MKNENVNYEDINHKLFAFGTWMWIYMFKSLVSHDYISSMGHVCHPLFSPCEGNIHPPSDNQKSLYSIIICHENRESVRIGAREKSNNPAVATTSRDMISVKQ